MLTLRYRFDSYSAADCTLACSLALWLASHLKLKLETAGPPVRIPELYPLFSQPLLQAEVTLHTTADFQPDPAAANVWWWHGQSLPAAEILNQADELWSATPAGVDLLKQYCPGKPVRYLPPCLNPDAWKAPVPPPAELELTAGQTLLLWFGRDERQLKTVLATFVPLTQSHPELLLGLQLDQVSEHFEDELMETLVSLCQTHKIADPHSLNIQTLIGPLDTAGLHALLQHCQILLAPENPLLALAARSLGKQVIAPSGLLPPEAGCMPWLTDPNQNQIHLKRALEQAAPTLSDTTQETFSVAVIGQNMLECLERLPALINLPARRTTVQASRQARSAALRKGRQQKYSLFHADYQSDELQARRAWHARYAACFETARAEIMDIGCGSGIFLEILKEQGIPAFGIDPDPDMVMVCQNLGLQALTGDERLLGECAENSLGGIHASHVIEHIDGQRAIALVENAFTALVPGGQLVIRTPNWRNETVRHEGFWLDITHIRPYPLPLLQQVLKDVGFEVTAAGFEDFGWNDIYIIGQKPLTGAE